MVAVNVLLHLFWKGDLNARHRTCAPSIASHRQLIGPCCPYHVARYILPSSTQPVLATAGVRSRSWCEMLLVAVHKSPDNEEHVLLRCLRAFIEKKDSLCVHIVFAHAYRYEWDFQRLTIPFLRRFRVRISGWEYYATEHIIQRVQQVVPHGTPHFYQASTSQLR